MGNPYKHMKKKPDLTAKHPEPGKNPGLNRQFALATPAFERNKDAKKPMILVKNGEGNAILSACMSENPQTRMMRLSQLLNTPDANPNVCNEQKVTGLMLIVQTWDLGLIEKMLQKGADPHAKDANGEDIFFYVSTYNAQNSENFRNYPVHGAYGDRDWGGPDYEYLKMTRKIGSFKEKLKTLVDKYSPKQ
jgi:hypothetical protein